MTTVDEIKKELEARGFFVTISTIIKNQVPMTGLTIKKNKNDSIAPCVYATEHMLSLNSENAVDMIIKSINANGNIDIDANIFLSPENIRKNVYIALQRSSDQDLIKKPTIFEGIEKYLYIRGQNKDGGYYTTKLTTKLLDNAGIAEDDIWKTAEENTFNEEELDLFHLQNYLSDFVEDENNPISKVPFFVITNKPKLYGAVQIFNESAIRKFAADHNYDRLIVIPSSLHEVIVLGTNESDISLSHINEVIGEVNDTQVDAVDQLGDHAYILNISC